MIQFKDFAIKTTKPAGWLNSPEFEPLEETLLRVNNWIEENELMVLNVETIVLPNVYDDGTKRTSSKGAYKSKETGSGSPNWWYQIFRVWYQL